MCRFLLTIVLMMKVFTSFAQRVESYGAQHDTVFRIAISGKSGSMLYLRTAPLKNLPEKWSISEFTHSSKDLKLEAGMDRNLLIGVPMNQSNKLWIDTLTFRDNKEQYNLFLSIYVSDTINTLDAGQSTAVKRKLLEKEAPLRKFHLLKVPSPDRCYVITHIQTYILQRGVVFIQNRKEE